jgi:hypothetical protein
LCRHRPAIVHDQGEEDLSRSTKLACALTALAIFPAAAIAANDDVRQPGTCSGNATSRIKLSPSNGRIETEFEVDQNRSGVTWSVVLKRNGNVAVRTSATTHRPSGSFELRRVLGNGAGPDRIAARATSPSGQVCTAHATI